MQASYWTTGRAAQTAGAPGAGQLCCACLRASVTQKAPATGSSQLESSPAQGWATGSPHLPALQVSMSPLVQAQPLLQSPPGAKWRRAGCRRTSSGSGIHQGRRLRGHQQSVTWRPTVCCSGLARQGAHCMPRGRCRSGPARRGNRYGRRHRGCPASRDTLRVHQRQVSCVDVLHALQAAHQQHLHPASSSQPAAVWRKAGQHGAHRICRRRS